MQDADPNWRGATPRPVLLVVAGPPCSGKTTLARRLAEKYGIAHLEMDAIRARILPEAGNGAEARSMAYLVMHLMGEVLLAAGQGVILDATYGPAAQRAGAEQLALRTGAELHLIQCRVAPEIAAARFAARDPDHPADDLTSARVRTLARRYPLFEPGMVVDADPAARRVTHDEHILGRRSLLGPAAGWSAAAVGRWP